MGIKLSFHLMLLVLVAAVACSQATSDTILIPQLDKAPQIDGDLSDWKDLAFTDGAWNLARLKGMPWYDSVRNRLTNHNETENMIEDLVATYYMAWDHQYLYLGAEGIDNVNDVIESNHAPKRWYYKDAIAWFIEAPGDDINETFGPGDHAFAFIMDTSYPDYGAWWRHGTVDSTFIEEPLPEGSFEYRIRNEAGEYTLEAKIDMSMLMPIGDPAWSKPNVGDIYKMMIVHCDPDGGEYGGHLLIYGSGDNDGSWMNMMLVEKLPSTIKKEK